MSKYIACIPRRKGEFGQRTSAVEALWLVKVDGVEGN